MPVQRARFIFTAKMKNQQYSVFLADLSKECDWKWDRSGTAGVNMAAAMEQAYSSSSGE
jgi:hypothetical protein